MPRRSITIARASGCPSSHDSESRVQWRIEWITERRPAPPCRHMSPRERQRVLGRGPHGRRSCLARRPNRHHTQGTCVLVLLFDLFKLLFSHCDHVFASAIHQPIAMRRCHCSPIAPVLGICLIDPVRHLHSGLHSHVLEESLGRRLCHNPDVLAVGTLMQALMWFAKCACRGALLDLWTGIDCQQSTLRQVKKNGCQAGV